MADIQTKRRFARVCTLVLLCVTSFITIACVPNEQPKPGDTPELSIDKNSLSFAGNGGNAAFKLTAGGTWQAAIDADWFTMNPSSGSSNADIIAAAAPNPTASERRTTVRIYLTAYPEVSGSSFRARATA